MIRFISFTLIVFLLVPAGLAAQRVTYSDYERGDSRDTDFEIIGKMNGNVLVYKNIRWKHKLCIYDNEMKTKEIVDLDFVPEKTYNADFIVYPDFFYMIYQYRKKSILHCMGVKLDANGKKMSEPAELDTTEITLMADTKIYSTIYSEDKQKIMLFKIQKKWDRINMTTLLLDDKLQLQHKSRYTMDFEERHDAYGDFIVDNDGNFAFTTDRRPSDRENSKSLNLITKAPLKDDFISHSINLDGKFLEEVRLKADNLNKQYIINSFYCPKSWGRIEGLFTCTWDRVKEKQNPSAFNVFDDYLRAEAKSDGQVKFAFDDFVIREVFVKKDGGFVLVAEDFSMQNRVIGSPWNRWDYMNNSFSSTPYYTYRPYYGNYRPLNSYSNNQSVRFYYANIMVLSVDKKGTADWAKVIQKDQFEDDNDSFLSFSTMNSGGEIHFLYNLNNKNEVISDQSIAADGTLKRNATLKSEEKGYKFMPQLAKQTSARQLIIPCEYRGNICFAKVDF